MQRIYPFLFILTAPLLWFSFPSFDFPSFKAFPLVAWVALVPLLFSLRRERSFVRALAKSFIAGVFFTAFSIGWMGAFGAGWYNIGVPFLSKFLMYLNSFYFFQEFDVKLTEGSIVIFSLLVPATAAVFALKISIAEFVSRRFRRGSLVVFAAIWVAFDFISTLGNFAFPWNFLGYSQYPFTPVIQIASLTGVYGVTFLIVLLNGAIAGLVESRLSTGAFCAPALRRVLATVALVGGVIVFGLIRPLSFAERTPRPFTAVIAQACIDPWDDWGRRKYDYLGEQVRLTQEGLAHKPQADLVIWSESAALEPISFMIESGRQNRFLGMLQQYAAYAGKPILLGEIGREVAPGGRKINWYNSACIVSPQGTVAGRHYKTHLAPIGEWFPYAKLLPSVQELIYSMGGSTFTAGATLEPLSLGSARFGVGICYESIFPAISRTYTRKNADFLLNITNDGWSSSYRGHMQHYAASVFRAVENGRWVIRAGNTGQTAFINPFGRLTASIPILNKGYLASSADLSLSRATFYTHAGDVFALLCVFVFLLVAVLMLVRRNKSADTEMKVYTRGNGNES